MSLKFIFATLFMLTGLNSFGQLTLIHQESFETNGEGTRYVSNTFLGSTTSDYWGRTDAAGNGTQGTYSFLQPPVSIDGSSFWAGEDVDDTGNPLPPTGVITLNPISVTGYSSLEVRGLFAALQHFKYEATDGIFIEADLDGGGFTGIGGFWGYDPLSQANKDIRRAGTFPFTTASVGGTILDSLFRDFTFPVSSTGNNLTIRITFFNNGGTEELAMDNIRVFGILSANNPPVLAAIEGSVLGYIENMGAVNLTSTLTVTDSDNANQASATVSIVGNLRSCEDELLFTNQNGITGTWSAATGVLSLTGSATNANYQTALRSVQYRNNNTTNPDTNQRTVRFVTNDGTSASNNQDRQVTISRSLTGSGTIPYQESFETDGNGVRYDANAHNNGTTSLWDRLSNPNALVTNPTNVNGSFYFAGTDVDATAGTSDNCVNGNPDPNGVGTIILNDIDITGYTNLQVTFAAAALTPTGWDAANPKDRIRFEASIDGGPYTYVGGYYANGATQLEEDTDLDLAGGPSGNILGTAFSDVTLNISGTGSSLSIRVEVFANSQAEELALDDIRVNGILACTAASVSTDPNDATICLGSNASFTADTTGTADSLRWHVSTNGGTSWTTLSDGGSVSGATALTLNLTAPGLGMDGNQYRLVVYSCSATTDSSNAATLNVSGIAFTFCPPNKNVTNTVGLCGTTVTYTAPAAAGADSIVQTAGQISGATYQVGSTLNQFVAYKGTCTDTCEFFVVVADTQLPALNGCKNDTSIYANASCQRSYSWLAPTASDNCPGQGLVEASGFNSPEVFDAGIHLIKYIATDASGNQDSCSWTVTVLDTTSPNWAGCPTNMNVDADPNTCGKTVSWTNPTISDNCLIDAASLDTNITPGSFFAIGTTTVYYAAADTSGNVDTCTFTVTVNDTTPPAALCQDITVYLNGGGNATITASDVDNGSADSCGIASLSASPTSFNCSNTGANTVTLTVTDNNGNVSTCTSTVTVEDSTAPSAVCQDITVFLDGAGNATITAGDVDGGSTDNCGVSLSASPTAFTCVDVGANSVTLTATDPSGNTDNCTATVTVSDTTAPTATCQNITVFLDGAGSATITGSDVDGGSSDNCGIASTSASPSAFTCSNTGANAVTLTVTDVNANTSTCSATVTVVDSTAPSAVCQDITVFLSGGGTASISGADVDGGSSDNCSIASSLVNGVPTINYNCSNVGANAVTLQLMDPSGNTDNCSATVTVSDTTAPNAVCQNITVFLDGSGNISITGSDVDGGSSDACGIASLSASPSAFTCSNTGSNAVTLTVTDVNGNSSTCSSTVTVVDSTAPSAVCQDITVFLSAGGTASITGADVDGGSTDNCSISNTLINGVPTVNYNCSNVGANAVTLQVSDPSGNTDNCSATVTVVDSTAPTAVCQNITVFLDGSGNISITGSDVDGGSSDACGIASRSASPSAFTCSNTGSNSVTLTVTDVNGNSATCTATVTVNDTTAPVAVCQDLTLQLDGSGNASTSGSAVDNGSSDNCSISSMSLSDSTFTCSDLGANSVTLTVIDPSGNTDNCSATITVEDNVAPSAVCQNLTIYLDGLGNANIVSANVDNGSTDNCTITHYSLSDSIYNCSDAFAVAGNQSTTLTVIDQSGNSDNCVSTITVLDTIAPVIVCPNDTVVAADPGVCTHTATFPSPTRSDNCSPLPMTNSKNFTGILSGTFNAGTTNVVWTVTDPSNNSDTCHYKVTVVDSQPPVLTCPADTMVNVDGSCQYTIHNVVALTTITDNCTASGSIIKSQSIASGTVVNIGDYGVWVFATDLANNTDSCLTTIMVRDTTAPTAICQDITLQLDTNGQASTTSSAINNGSSDNCQITSVSLSDSSFTCGDLGANSVTLTVIDSSGNSSTCTATVTIEDNIAPTAICQNLTLQLDGSGNASTTGAAVNNGSTDNCSITSVSLSDSTFDCADLGSNSVTLTVIDQSGNSDNCSATITVQDTVSPVALCQDITLQLDGSGNASTTSSAVDNGSSDNCAITSSSLSDSTYTCTNLGANSVTLTVIDQSGNSSTCTATVTVEDTVAPTAICQDITLQLDTNGQTSTTSSAINNGSSDNCTITSVSLSDSTYNCNDLGANSVTLTVIDQSGNSSTCTATVTVEDNLAPTALCQDITLWLDGSGQASTTSSAVNNGSTDNCTITSISLSDSTYSCNEIGANSVTLTVIDQSGNSSTCTATVTVEDTVAPTAICQNITLWLDAGGNASTSSSAIDNGSFDNCAITHYSLSDSVFTCSNVGSNAVTLTVIDSVGNVDSCSATVMVMDTIAPTAMCKDTTVYLGAVGTLSIDTSWVNNGSFDNCAIDTMYISQNSFNCADTGVQQITLVVMDVNGNSDSCVANVTVLDSTPPVITFCPANQTLPNTPSNCGRIVTYATPTATDNCQVDSITIGNTDNLSGQLFPVGTTTVTWTAYDPSLNTTACVFTITINDTELPKITGCPTNKTVNNSAGQCGAAVNWTAPTASDNCPNVTLTSTHSPGDFFAVGTDTVVYTATDSSGNIKTCTFTVTVNDNEAPQITCPANITVSAGAGNCTAVVNYITPVGTDNCPGVTTVQTLGLASGDSFSVGTTTNTFVATDGNGLQASCSFTVTVNDGVAPVITCPANDTISTDPSFCFANYTYATPTAVDNCDASPVVSQISGPASGGIFNKGTTAVTWQATDNSGNTSQCTFTVRVYDGEAPVIITCPVDVTKNADPGQCTAAVTIPIPQSGIAFSDNCPNPIMINNHSGNANASGTYPVGVTTVMWTVTDQDGNKDTCYQTVTIIDNQPPTAVCQNITVFLNNSGSASITPADVDGGSSDQCGIVNLSINDSTFNCTDVGANTVTLTVADTSGNSVTCNATVTVSDTVSPVALCQDVTVYLDNGGNASITTNDINNGSNDACGVASVSLDSTSFDCSEVGPNTVTLTVVDSNANSSTCTAKVTVMDTVAPVALCQDITVQLDGSGNASITANEVDNGSNDACGIASLSAAPTSFNCSNIGANTVTLTATDNNGNSSTCTSTVTIADTVAPQAVCQDITIYLDGSGNVSINASDVDGGSSDACGINSLSASPTAFTCSNVGGNLVTLTVSDNNGNTASCVSTVTVQDTVSPVAVCQSITVYLDASGNVAITANDIDNGSTDACGIDTLMLDTTAFNCSDVGSNPVTLTATDNNGNTSTCSATVTVMDTVVPVALCQDITVQLDGSGNASITANDIDNGSNDACGIASTAVNPNSFTCSNAGANPVTLTVTDNNGNSSTCTATVTIEDTIAPVAVCQNDTLWLDASGMATNTAADLDGGSSDNCAVDTLISSQTMWSCTDVGSNPTTLYVYDASGNVDSCTAMVMVIDTVAPVASCIDTVLYLDGNGNAFLTANVVDNGSSDACGIASSSVTPNAFNCSNTGANTVTLTVTDNNGNSDACTATVTVLDTLSPTIICPANITISTGVGICQRNVTVPLATKSDNCSATVTNTFNFTNNASGIYPKGTTTVTFIAVDPSGNSANCQMTVTVVDNEAPNALCADTTLYLDASGQASVTVNDLDGGTTDNCALDTLFITPAGMFDCSNVGVNAVVLTAIDQDGNTDTCTALVTVVDTTAPVVSCLDTTLYLDASGMASLGAMDLIGSISDSCGIDSVWASQTVFTCSDTGANAITVTVMDNNANLSSCTSTVTVLDTTPPAAMCQDVTLALDNNGNAVLTPSMINDSSFDNCSIDSMWVSQDSFTCSNTGPNSVTLSVSDVNGNLSSCTATVTVEDTIAPTAVCYPTVSVYLDASGNASITTTDIDSASFDNCAVDSLSIDITSFNCSDLGSQKVTLTVWDASGNMDMCQSNVDVTDTIAPVALCQNVTVYLDNSGMASILASDVDSGSTDACGIASLVVDSTSFDCSEVGANMVTLTVTDSSANSASCMATVMVMDTVAPVAICSDTTLYLNGSGMAMITANDLGGNSTDNCGIDTITASQTMFTCADSTVMVIITVLDVNGNTSSCTSTVTVIDSTAPLASCMDITVQLDGSGMATISDTAVNNGSSDNCSIASITSSPTSFNCSNVGANTVTLTVMDASGNVDSCTATVTVEDTVPPVAVCMDTTLVLNSLGNASLTANDLDGGSTDNCAISSITASQLSFNCTDVGANNILLTVTDVNGNSDTCTAVVTVTDTTAPAIANCPLDVTINNTPNNCGSSFNWTAPTATDACGLASLVGDNVPNSFFQVGTTTVTYTATDVNGNVSLCSFDVTVIDNEDPKITGCPGNKTAFNGVGQCSAIVSWNPPTASDNCPGVVMVSSHNPGTSFNVGQTTVTYVATDSAGHTDTCQFVVTVLDTASPQITCPANISVSNTVGQCAATVSYTTPVGTDNCAGATTVQSAGQPSGSSFAVGTTTNTFVVTDASGNVDSCSFTVTVNDTEVPQVTCPADITVSNDSNQCSAVVSYTAPVGTDNCAGDTTTQSAGLGSGATFPVGVTTETYVVTDASGNVDSCSFTITVNDTEVPQIACPADVTVNNDSAQCSAVVSYTTPVGTDNCAGASTTQSAGLGSGSAFPVGMTTETYVVTDASGNSDSCSFTITVNDTEAPQITCPADVTVSNDAGMCSATVNYTTPVGTDNCAGASTTQSAGLGSGASFALGTTTESYLVTDASGNVDSCSFTITVEDTEAPQITCPADLTVSNDSGMCDAVVTYTAPVGTDNCPGATTIQTAGLGSGATFAVGSTVETYQVTDAAGNLDSCSFTITVQDNEAPSIVCPADTVIPADSGQCSAMFTYTSPVGMDNCPNDSTFQSAGLGSGATFPVGMTTETYVVIDQQGTSDSCSFTVTVLDIEAPVVTCPADTMVNNDAGNCSAVFSYTTPVGTDNCAGASTTQTAGLASGATFPLGATTNTFVVTDGSGNMDSCSFTVTVMDAEAPQITCPANLTVNTDPGQCSAVVNYTAPVGTDNCPGASTTLSSGQGTGGTFALGVNTETYVVTDGAGNTDSCSFTITVEDHQNPTIVCPANFSVNNDNGFCGAVVTYTTPVGTDNCAMDTTVLLSGGGSGSFFSVGVNGITWQATDAAGNTASCSFNITVVDAQAPAITCPSNITVSNDAGQCSAVVSYTAPVGTDNCPGTSTALTAGLGSGSAFPLGVNTETYTATDGAGNQTSCSFTITVNDNEAPQITCPADLTVSNDSGMCAAVVSYTTPVGTDNCPGVSTTQTAGLGSGSSFAVGVTTESYLAVDSAGNVDSCSFTITVEDNENPMAVCQNVTVYLDGSGMASVTTLDVDNGSGDNCGIDSMWVAPSSFTCVDTGANSVTLTVMDFSGNMDSCVATVTVMDSTPPAALCMDITLQLDSNGNASIVAGDIDGGSTDNCTIASLVASQTAFNCSNVGANSVTLTVTDVNGNVDSCTATVTVEDNEAPMAVCQDITLFLDGSGNAGITAGMIDGGSTDNCAVDTIMASQTAFTCSNVGGNSITLTVLDVNGNTDTCTAMVTVVDSTAPVALCMDVTVYLDTAGTASINAGMIDGGSNDACGVGSISASLTSFTCVDTGANSVTLTVTDVNGNVDSCTATVTVLDTVAPMAVCQNITVYLDSLGSAAITANDVDGGSTDNCGVDSLSASPTAFNCSNLGANGVTLSVTDVSGNMASCIATVTVEDTTSPWAVCLDTTLYLNALGTASITANDLGGNSTDNCSVDSLSASVTSFSCNNTGANSVTVSVWDGSGNMSTCVSTVTVLDTLIPDAVCQMATTYLDGSGNATITVNDVDGGSTDNCGVDTVMVSQSLFTCGDLGSNTVTLTVTDLSGNMDTCSATVMVMDTIAPVISGCPADTTLLAAANNCVPNFNWTAPTVSDNCGALLTSNYVPGDSFYVGSTTVIYAAVDSAGNTDTCSFVITVTPNPLVISTTSPTLACGTNIACNGDSTGTASVAIIGGCGPYTISWSNGGTTDTINGIPAGTYIVTVTDSMGTTVMDTITLTEPAPLSLSFGGNLLACGGDSSATIDLTVTGGSTCGSYGYLWNTGASTEDLSNLPAGMYTVMVADTNGCFASDSVAVQTFTPEVISLGNDTTICAGGSLVLDATNAAFVSYLWSNSDTTGMITVSTAGTYSVTATDTNGCDASDTIMVSVAAPVVVDLGADTTICNGSSLTLDAGAYAYYLWNTMDSTMTITVSSAGTYYVDVWDSIGCTGSDTIDVSIYTVAPSGISAAGVLCNNDEVQLSADAGFSSYLWDNGDTTQTTIITTQGYHTVTVSDGTGCLRTDSVYVDSLPFDDPNPFITPGGTVYLCSGSSLVLDVGEHGGTYLWNNGDTTRKITVTQAGTYYALVTNGLGCSAYSDTVTVLADAAVSPFITQTMSGQDTILNANPQDPSYTYQWFGFTTSGGASDTIIPGATGATYQPTNPGCYIVQITTMGGCAAKSDTFCITITGIEDPIRPLTGIDVFPNPTRDYLTIRTIAPIDYPVDIRMTDMYGKIVKHDYMNHLVNDVVLDLTRYSKGMYILEIEAENGQKYTVRVVIEE
ncbi:MAG: HYR domain-containing protein [Bacteroidia bacterium]|nr:HYR domain-containing protein [Bacteroidia bacterium]